MYAVLAILLMLLGGVLMVFAKKMGEKKKGASRVVGILGAALMVVGAVGLYLLLTGTIELPLA